MIIRNILPSLKRYLQTFPVVLVTGARQVGKTTLVRQELPQFKYILLESPDQRNLALTDPRRFLEANPSPAIFDEFQNVPSLTQFLQEVIDLNRDQAGQFVLTGSQNFLIMEQVTQSLAGRIGILTMHGLNSEELPIEALERSDFSLGRLILRGTYPELWKNLNISEQDWYNSYIQTYIERDVRKLANIGDILSFERFVRICAARTGQVVNFSEIASDSGISVPTAQRWISILQSTHIIRLVQPFFENIPSRVRKAPKLYFMDTGLACYLMGYRDVDTMMNSPQYGPLFETLVYSDFVKRTSAQGEIPEHFYLQTKSKVGADLLVRKNRQLTIIEIKGNKTLNPKLASLLVETAKVVDKNSRFVLTGPFSEKAEFEIQGVTIQATPWTEMNYD